MGILLADRHSEKKPNTQLQQATDLLVCSKPLPATTHPIFIQATMSQSWNGPSIRTALKKVATSLSTDQADFETVDEHLGQHPSRIIQAYSMSHYNPKKAQNPRSLTPTSMTVMQTENNDHSLQLAEVKVASSQTEGINHISGTAARSMTLKQPHYTEQRGASAL